MAENSLPKTVQKVVVYDAPTTITGTRYALASNDVKRIASRPWPRHRKSVIITNDDNSNKLSVVAASSEAGGTQELKWMSIYKNSSIVIDTSDDVFIKAADGAISEVQILEVVYNG